MTDKQESGVYDVAVIGGGVVGCAIARELAQYQLAVVLIEAKSDVGAGTSKANTAILHTGFDAKPNYLEAKLVTRGYELLKAYGPEAGIPIEPLGGLLVAWNQEQLEALHGIRDNAHQNGVTDVDFISSETVYEMEPALGPGALGALIVPGESIICPFTTPLAFATQAVINGVALLLNSPVTSIKSDETDNHVIGCPEKQIRARFLVNAAGLHSDTINQMLGHDEFHITPRRGELIVYDKMARDLINHILMPVPTSVTKGVMICPTVFGNILLGPTAENLTDRTATNTTADGLALIQEKGRQILPDLPDQEVTALYAGLRAASEHGDYQIHLHAEERYLCVGGIRSTGLTASMAIAEYAAAHLEEAGLQLEPRIEFKTVRMPNIGEAFARPYQLHDLIGSNPDYGRIVCHCERVTQGEIIDATQSVIPAHDVESLRRRTRATMGRCQGFFCSADVAALLAEQTGKRVAKLMALE